ncbi:MAG TPA: hypothetical protein VFV43_05580, partial [Limnobacter sp.]|nr:hypothetical protein [Limnobacter sp.]
FVPTAEQQGLQDLLHHVFGGTQAFDEGHLNVLKMMNLIHGNASSPASTWSLSTEGAAVLRLLQQPNNQAFIPALSMFNLDQADITLANGVRGYFNAQGGFQQGFDVTHVEKVADRILKSLMPPNTLMPTDITLGDRVASTLNFLFGLPANNTRFDAEQVNTAIAIGLIQRNPNNTSQLILTTNGNGYWSAKDAAGKPKDVDQPKPNTPPTPLTRDEQVAAWALALQSFFPGQSAFHLFDGGRDGWKTGAGNNAYRHDSKIGNSDLQALAGRDPTVDKYWTGIFQNLSVADRHRLVALAKYGYENDLFGHMMSQQGPGQRYNGLMHDGFVRGGINIDEFVAGLPANTPRLHYVTGSNGYVTIQERRP